MQRKKFFLIAVLLFFLIGFVASFQPIGASFSVSASSDYVVPPVEWNRTYDGFYGIDSLSRTSDDGYILGGELGGEVQSAAHLVKTDSLGNVLWNKSYQQVGYELRCYSSQQTFDGGYVMIGGIRNALAHDDSSAWLCKTDEKGDLLWNKTYGQAPDTFALSGKQTADGGYVLAGETYGDLYLVKTDPLGLVEWNRTYEGNGFGYASSVQQTLDGGYILAGETRFYSQSSDCWLVKTDSSGEMEWNETYGGSGADEAYCVRQTSDGGYIFAGVYNVTNNRADAWVVKIDSIGGIEWTDGKSIASGSGEAFALSVEETSDGGYIVVGGVRFQGHPSEIFLFKTHSKGSGFDWNVTYGDGSQWWQGKIVVLASDGGYAVGGVVQSTVLLMKIMPDRPLVARFRCSPSTPTFQESILFDSTYSYDRIGDIVSYLWNFDDGNITSVTNPIIVHRYENAGIYNVSLRVVDAEGLNSTYSLILCAKIPTSISLSTSTPSATAGYSISISGTLLDSYGNRIRNESVSLYYAYSGYEDWNSIASELTDSSGSYSGEWIPPTPSYFFIKTVYAGNYTHVESSRNVALCMLPYGEMYLFSVESNSTVSSMGFDTNNQTLSFTATGEMGTAGYAKVTAAKSLVPNLALLSVHVDGAEYNYTVTDTDDSWVLLFAYDHSVHLVEIQLDSTIPEFPSFLMVALFMIGTVLAVIAHKKKHSGNLVSDNCHFGFAE